MSFSDELVAAFQPWMTPDLEAYLRTLGEMFDEVEWYVEDTEDADGWTVIFDVTQTKYKDLRWLGQFIGEELPIGHPESLAREWLRDKVNQRRGTIGAILRAAQRHLTGARTVTWQERTANLAAVGADIDALTIITYGQETPSPSLTLRDIQSAVPGDIVLYYETQFGQRWSTVVLNNGTWNNAKAAYASWDQMKTTNVVTEGNSISRPIPTS